MVAVLKVRVKVMVMIKVMAFYVRRKLVVY